MFTRSSAGVAKHTHTPSRFKVRGHGIYEYKCERCGRWIRWIPELPNRKGHWRAV